MYHEVVILVENIDRCRYFYREVLKLEHLIADSSSLVVFALGENASLVLEHCPEKFMEHASGAVRFAIGCDDIAALADRMKKESVVLSPSFERLGKNCFRACDPEGNPFLVVENTR